MPNKKFNIVVTRCEAISALSSPQNSSFCLEDLNRAIRALLDEYNDRPFQQLEGSRRSVFEKLVKPALKPLPQHPFEYEEWEQRRVNLDYHVRLRADEHNYSVPHRLVGETIDVRLTANTVECFHKGQRVASHLRSHQKNGHTTLPEHMPRAHREHAKWTPERIIHWVDKAGPCATQVAERILASRPFTHRPHHHRRLGNFPPDG